jgi:hypothetical protein
VATVFVCDMAITGVATIGDGGMVVAARAMVAISGIGAWFRERGRGDGCGR